MKKRNFTTLLALALVSGTLVLASCGGPDTPNSTGGTGPASSSSTPDANVDEDGLEIINDALAAATEPLNSRTILMMMQE